MKRKSDAGSRGPGNIEEAAGPAVAFFAATPNLPPGGLYGVSARVEEGLMPRHDAFLVR